MEQAPWQRAAASPGHSCRRTVSPDVWLGAQLSSRFLIFTTHRQPPSPHLHGGSGSLHGPPSRVTQQILAEHGAGLAHAGPCQYLRIWLVPCPLLSSYLLWDMRVLLRAGPQPPKTCRSVGLCLGEGGAAASSPQFARKEGGPEAMLITSNYPEEESAASGPLLM